VGLGIQTAATFVYAWRFGALTFEPLRLDVFLFERRTAGLTTVYDDSGDSPAALGISRNGIAISASLGASLDLSAIVLSIRDGIVGVTNRILSL
jgi:hypothetical protein